MRTLLLRQSQRKGSVPNVPGAKSVREGAGQGWWGDVSENAILHPSHALCPIRHSNNTSTTIGATKQVVEAYSVTAHTMEVQKALG